MFNAPQRVARGAAMLDEHYGSKRWVDNIRLSRLDLGSQEDCVLGQLFGRYRYACDILGANRTGPRHGFVGWTATRRAWVEEITARRVALDERHNTQRAVQRNTYALSA